MGVPPPPRGGGVDTVLTRIPTQALRFGHVRKNIAVFAPCEISTDSCIDHQGPVFESTIRLILD